MEASGSISTKEIPIKGISPASTRCRGNPARLHACTHAHALARVHACTRTERTNAYLSAKLHTPFAESGMCARVCARSHTSRKRNRVGGEARMTTRTTTTTMTMGHTHIYTSHIYRCTRYCYTTRCFTDEVGVKQPSNSRGGAYSQP